MSQSVDDIMKDKILAAHAYYSKVNNFIVLLKYFVHSQKKKIIQNYIIYIKNTDYRTSKINICLSADFNTPNCLLSS